LAAHFGGGADYKFWCFLSLPAAVWDFYTGGPSYNSPATGGGQQNVAASGLVLRLRLPELLLRDGNQTFHQDIQKTQPHIKSMKTTVPSPALLPVLPLS
jgi:hypothetical protein